MSRQALLTELVEAGLLTQQQAVDFADGGGLTVGQGAAVADPTGGATVDTQARTAIASLLGELRTLGIIAT